MRSAAHHLLLLLVLPALLLAAPAATAWAGDWVEGDGYRFRLPPEFLDVKQSRGGGQEELQGALELVNGMTPPGLDLDVKAFVRQRGAEPDAILFVMAMHLQDGQQEAASGMNLDAFEQGMRQAQSEIEKTGALIEISRIRRILVSAGHPALEIEINVDDPELGPLNSMRALYVVKNGSFCMLGYQGMRKNAGEDGMLWRAIVTSFRLEARGSILSLLMRYGPFLLGGLVLLIALVFLKKSSSSKQLIRPVLSTRPGGSSESGFSRALDGLPTYANAGGDVREPVAGGEPGPAAAIPAPASSPGGPLKAPTIPRAAPVAPSGEPDDTFSSVAERPPRAVEAPVAPSGGPSGLPRKLPQASTDGPGTAAPPPAPPAPLPPMPLPTGGVVQPPAVAERIEIEDLPVGSDMPTNVAMRSGQAPVPEADTADQVLSRLMGFEDGPAPEVEPAHPPAEKPEASKITRNSDFFGS